jgi:hypothetical protein
LLTTDDTWDEETLEIYPVRKLRSSKVLRDLGIKIIASGFPQLNPSHPGIRGQLVDYWRSHWQRRASVVEAEHALEAIRTQTEARMEAQEGIINTIAQIFDMPETSQDALAIQIFQALDSFAADPKTRILLPETAALYLKDIRGYLLGEGED